MKTTQGVISRFHRIVLCCVAVWFCQSQVFAIAVGDRVRATGTVNVRSTAAGSVLGTQSSGSQGTVTAGPTVASLGGVSYTWFNINFDTGTDGWVATVGLVQILTLNTASSNPNSGVYIYVGPNDILGRADATTAFSRIYDLGTPITLIAPLTAGGNNFQKWQRNGSDFSFSTTVNFSMSAAYTLTAVYAAPPPVTRTLTVESSNPNSGVSITANQPDNNNNFGGTTTFSRTFNINANVSFNAPATSGGNNFQKWQKNGVDLTTSTTASVTMDANHTITAVYVSPPTVYTLNVQSSNPNSGVYVYVGPNDTLGRADGTTSFSRTFNSGTSVTLIAPLTAGGNNFQKWQRNGSDLSYSTTVNFSMNAAYTLTAVYVPAPPVTRTLTVASSNPNSGVNITANQPDNNNNFGGTTTFTRTFNDNATVSFNAPATAGGNTFQKWQKNGADLTTSTTASVTMEANHTITAVYATSPSYTITTASSPPAGGTASGGGDFTSGQTATVTATANNGYGFVNWTEGGNQVSTSASYPFTVTASRSLVANFGRTATVVGTGGLGLRLRSNPNLSSTVLAVIPDGSIVITLGNTQSADGYVWWRVRYLAQDGWAVNDFLALTSTGTPPTPPSIATLLQQFQANGTTSVSGGGTANASSVVLAARTSGTSGQQMKIQFEVRPAGGSFSSPTHESAFVPGGTEARITASGLANQGYDWRARVLDANGQASSWTQFSASSPDFVVSTPALPSALFSWSPTQPFVNNTVQFTASAAGTAGLTFAWNFGDGGTATGPTPNHTFAQTGQRTVTLTVTDSQSRQATRAETLTVASSQLPDAINLLAQRTANLYDTILAEAQQCANAADYFQQGVDSAQSRIAISAAFDAISLGIDAATFKGWLQSSIGEEILGQTVLDLERTATERVIAKKASQSHSVIFMPNIQTFISQRKAEIEQLRQQAIAASGSLAPSQAEQLARNLQARSTGNSALANNYSSKALLPTTFADLKSYDENSWTYLVGEKLFGASVGLGMILTGGAAHGTLAVMLSVSGTTALGTFDKLNILSGQSMDAQMLGLSVNVLGQSTFTAREMADNAKRGLEAVISAQVPATPAGQLSVEHVAQGALEQFGFSPRWFTTTAYADVTIHNTGTVPAQYRLEAVYPKSFTTTQLLPFRTYGIGERSYPINVLSVANWVQVNPGVQTTIRLYYKTADGGQIPRGLINYTLTAKTANGHYLQDVETGRFGTIYLNENGQVVDPSLLPSGLLLADTPLRSALLQYGSSKICNLSIYVDNPVESPLLVNLQQPIPVGTSVIDAAGGTTNNNQVSWEFNLQPGEGRALQVTLNLPSLPGNPPLPDTTTAAYDTVNASWLQFNATPSLLQITNLPISQVQALGFSGGAFGVALHAFIPGAYRVEATKNFSTWETVGSSTNAQGILNFQDPAAQTNSIRFYRGIKIQ